MADGILKWANRNTRGHDHITPASDFEESWADGLCFCALFHAYFPDKIPIKTLKADTNEDKLNNLRLAFQVGQEVGIDPLLDPEDTLLVHEKKSLTLYLSEIYAVLKEYPVKFSASSAWNKKFDDEEKARKFAEWKAKKDAEAKGEVYTPQKATRTGSVANKWNPDGAKEEEPASTPTPVSTPTPNKNVAARWNSKQEEKEEVKPVVSTPSKVETKPAEPAKGEGLTYEIGGRNKDGATEGSMVIFTVKLDLNGKPLPNPKKEDLIVHVDCPGTAPRLNIMGGTGGSYHIGFTPTSAGQYWMDFVWRGTFANDTFMLPIKSKANKLPDHPYTGAERKAAGAVKSTTTPAPSTPAATTTAKPATTPASTPVGRTPSKPVVVDPSPEFSFCSDRTAEMTDEDSGSFTITAKDGSDQLLKGDYAFSVQINGPTSVRTNLKNNGDGTYTCTFGPVPEPGDYVILVTIGGKEIKKGKWDLKVTDAIAGVDFEDVTILFQATDKYGTPKTTGGDVFTVVATGDDVEIVDLEDGRYTIDYHVVPGRNSIDVLYEGVSLAGFPVVFEI